MVESAVKLPPGFDPDVEGFVPVESAGLPQEPYIPGQLPSPEKLPPDFDPTAAGFAPTKFSFVESVKKIPSSTVTALERSGIGMVGGLAGLALAGAEHPESLVVKTGNLFNKDADKAIKQWANEMTVGVDTYFKEHQAEALDIQSQGLFPVLAEVLREPHKLAQLVFESVPMMLEGALGTILGGPTGGAAMMGVPVAGDVYSEARKEGTLPNAALAQAFLSGAGEGIIEQWTLGKKFQLMRMAPKSTFSKMLWQTGKQYFRGSAEEGSQQFNRNFWRWIFTDRSQKLMEGVLQSAAMGGPAEAAMGGAFAGMGLIGVQRNHADRLTLLHNLEGKIDVQTDLTDVHKTEIKEEIDNVRQQVVEDFIELNRGKYPQEIKDNATLAEVGNAIARDFGIVTSSPIVWEFKKGKPKSKWGLHQLEHKKTGDIHTITIYDTISNHSQDSLKETTVHELCHIIKPPFRKSQPPLTKLPSNYVTRSFEDSSGATMWAVRDTEKNSTVAQGHTENEAKSMALAQINNRRQYGRWVSHGPEFKEEEIKRVKDIYEVIKLSAPGKNYEEAISKKIINPWIRNTNAKNNQGRWLMVQISNQLLNPEPDAAAERYYDKLYTKRKGYNRLSDFWEIPTWITSIAANNHNTDVYVVRDLAEAKDFLGKAGYNRVLFSVLDINKEIIRDLAESYNGKIIAGGYGEAPNRLTDLPNVKVYPTIPDMMKAEGREYIPSTDFRHFENSKSIPRLSLSKELTDIKNGALKISEQLKPKLIYIDDKTFGQVKNSKELPGIYKIAKMANPDFQGFIIQTTAGDFLKLDDKFLRDAGVKYVEIGVESFNDSILKSVHKPVTEELIEKAFDKGRKLGISMVPNIIVGLPGETAETYVRTTDFIRGNADVISHINVTNLALYPKAEMAETIKAKEGVDVDENKVAKSFHENPEIHQAFADNLYTINGYLLNVKSPSEIESEVVKSQRVQKEMSKMPAKRDSLILIRKISDKMGLSEVERTDIMEEITGKRSSEDMTPVELATVVEYFKSQYGGDAVVEPGDWGKPVLLGHKVTTVESIMADAARVTDELPSKIVIPEKISRRFGLKFRPGLWQQIKNLIVGVDNSTISQLAWMLGGNKDSIFTEVFGDNLDAARSKQDNHRVSVARGFQQFCKEQGITPDDLAEMSTSLNPRFTWLQRWQETKGTGTRIYPVKIGQHTFDFTMDNLIEFYLITNQEDGLRHIVEGGWRVYGVETGPFSDTDVKTLRTIVEQNPKVMAIIGYYYSVDTNIWKPSINNTSLRLEGKEIATEEKWYGLDVATERRLGGKAAKFNVNLIENKGILKDRTRSKLPLVMGNFFDRFVIFENAISEYFAFAEPLRIARTVLNERSISAALRNKGYSQIRENLRIILERTQSIPAAEGSFEHFIRKVTHGGYRAVLYFNLRVWVSQFTSVFNYGAYVDSKYMIPHIKDGLIPSNIDQVLEISDTAWNRYHLGTSSLELGELGAHDAVLQSLIAPGKGIKGAFKNLSDINKLGGLLRYCDIMAITSGWKMAEAEYADAQSGKIQGQSAIWWDGKRTDFKIGSEDWKRTVNERAEWLWNKTQPSWDKWNRSIITSEPSILKRQLFLFRSFHEKSLNIMQRATIEFQQSKKTSADIGLYAKRVGSVWMSYASNVVLRSIILAAMMRKIKPIHDYILDILGAPLQMFPIIGRVLNNMLRNVVKVFMGEPPEYRGFATESLPMRAIDTLAQAPGDFSQAAAYYINGETDKGNTSLKRAIMKTIEGAAITTGVPIYEIRNVMKGFEEEPEPGIRKTKGRKMRY